MTLTTRQDNSGFDSNYPRQILNKWGNLGITSKESWPETLTVFLESGTSGCHYFYAGVTMDWGKGDLGAMAMPFEQSFRDCFKSFSSYKQASKFIFCDYPNRDWYSQETFPELVKDVLANRSNVEALCPMADSYVETLMTLVKITDNVVQQTGANG